MHGDHPAGPGPHPLVHVRADRLDAYGRRRRIPIPAHHGGHLLPGYVPNVPPDITSEQVYPRSAPQPGPDRAQGVPDGVSHPGLHMIGTERGTVPVCQTADTTAPAHTPPPSAFPPTRPAATSPFPNLPDPLPPLPRGRCRNPPLRRRPARRPHRHAGCPALVPAARRGCCQAVRSRQVMEGGGILLLTRHAVDCPVWSTR
ncbi:hypothetical protein GCM10009663_39410 [Kitasatospora arboriphila]|uniref:Uncharacterized protein n=1 Tax=Kitasatospora arboriphila TaxID=258052 RepID=A0ABN1TKK1_9ACTN